MILVDTVKPNIAFHKATFKCAGIFVDAVKRYISLKGKQPSETAIR